MIVNWPGTHESWLTLLLVLAVAVWPLFGAAGIAIGRMQMEDEMMRQKRRALSLTRDGE